MKRSLFGISLCLLLFLAACSSSTVETPAADVEEAEVVVESEADSASDAAQAEPEAEEEPVVTESESEDASEEMVEEAAESEEAAVPAVDNESVFAAPNFPAVAFEDALVEREFDKVKGGDDPLITIIEYGDFQ